jgi:hypothetical protein
MNKINKIKVDKLIHKLGLDYNLPDDRIREIVESQFKFTAEKIKEIDFDTLEKDEDIENIKGTFLYRTFGKLYINQVSLKNYLNKKNGRINREHNKGTSPGTD